MSSPDEHETRRPAPRFPQPRIDDFTLKRSRGAVCRLYYPRRSFGAVSGADEIARNARTQSDQQVAQIAASIREFGFTNPVLIDEEDGIIAGR